MGGVAVLLLIWVVPVMGYNTQDRYSPPQPVPFSHKHHVSGLGLDCRYCHTTVEISQNAGMPPTETCMTCHSQIWTNAAILAPVRQSLAETSRCAGHAVYTLPDYVYFDHSIHIAKGVGCTECHGPIGDMPLTWKATSLVHELVPRLPSRSGAASAPARPGVQPALAAHARHAVRQGT